MKRVVLLIGLLVGVYAALPVAAQRTFKIEELTATPIDTLDTYHPEAKIITYTNNTWEYYFPNYEKLVDKDIFKNNWVENQVFAYGGISVSKLPESVDLELIKDAREFHMPTYGRISSRYGPRRRGMHKGIDICIPVGEPIYSVFEGKVRYAKYNSGGYGNLVIIRHPNGLETYYGHLCQLNIKLNDYVVAGQVIGYGGNTGRSSGPHLHFEFRYCDHSIDPERIIDFSNCTIKLHNFVLERKFFNAKMKPNESPVIEDDDAQLIEEDEVACQDPAEEAQVESEPSKPTSSNDLVEQKTDTKAPVTPSAQAATEPVYYSVKPTDTLYKIARMYNTSVDKLCELNNMSPSDILIVNRKLRVK